MDKTIDQFGRIDVLVNNAGISEFHNPFELDESNWAKILKANLKSVFFCFKAGYMKKMVVQL